MDASAVFEWPIPGLLDAANAPAAFTAFGDAIEQTVLSGGVWHSYLPSWTSEGKVQPTNPLTSVGWWRVSHGMCDVIARLTFGPSTNGGSGPLLLGLPIAPSSSAGEQTMRAKFVHSTGVLYVGSAQVRSKTREARILFPGGPTNSITAYWRNAVDPVAVGIGVPQITGAYTVDNGSNAMMCGRYRI